MADDISARIVIAVENANAVQQCDQVEDALNRVTQARRRDLSVAEQSSQQTNESASAIQEETAAIEQQVQARKKSRQELEHEIAAEKELARQRAIPREEQERRERESQKKRDDYNRKFDEAVVREEAKKRQSSNDGDFKDNSYAERKKAQQEEMEAAKRAMLAREEAEAKARDLIARRSFVSEQEAQKELARIELIAAKRKQMEAVINQSKVSKQLNRQKDLLYKETDKGAAADPRKVQAFQNAIKKLEDELTKAQRTALQTEQAARRAEQQVKRFGNSTRDAGNKAGRAADKNNSGRLGQFIKESFRGVRGLGRMFGERMTGVSFDTRNMTGEDKKLAMFSAATLAVGAIGNLINSIQQFRSEERRGEEELRTANLNSMREATMRVERESAKRNQQVSTLSGYNSQDKLNFKEQVHQQQILKQLNTSLGDMQISIDKTSGKIVNFGELQERIAVENKKREIASYELELKNIDAEISRQEQVLTKNGTGKLGDFWNQLVNKEAIRDAQTAIEKLNSRRQELQQKAVDARKFIGTEATQDRFALRWAGLKDEYKKIYEQRVSDMKGDIAWRREQKFFGDKSAENAYTEKNETERLKKLKEYVEKQQKQALELKAAMSSDKNKFNPEARAGLFAKINMIYKDLLPYQREISKLEESSFNRLKKRKQIDKTLEEKKNELKIQELIRKGESKKAEDLKLQLDLEKKRKEEGYTKKQLADYSKIVAEERKVKLAKLAEERDQRFAKLYEKSAAQYRSTSQSAVMSDSIEAMRLQSRMLVHNSPQQQLLDVNKQQYKVQQQIANNTRNSGVALRVVQA